MSQEPHELVDAIPQAPEKSEPDLASASLLAQLAVRNKTMLAEPWHEFRIASPSRPSSAAEEAVLQATFAEVFEILTVCLDARRGPTHPEIEQLESIGATSAAQGIPWTLTLRALRVEIRFCYRYLKDISAQLQGLDRTNAPPDDAFEQLLELNAEFEHAVKSGHTAISANPTHTIGAPNLPFLEAVLNGDHSEQHLNDWMYQLGLVVAESLGYTIMIMAPRGRHHSVEPPRLRDTVIETPSNLIGELTRIDAVPHTVALFRGRWQPSTNPTLIPKSTPNRQAVITTITTADSLARVGQIYRRIHPHISLIDSMSDAHGVLSLHELAICELLASIPIEFVILFVRDTFGPLLTMPSEKVKPWFHSLDALRRAGGKPKKASELGHCDVKTIYNHRQHVAALTGLDAANPKHLLRIALGLRLLRVHRDALPPLGHEAWRNDDNA